MPFKDDMAEAVKRQIATVYRTKFGSKGKTQSCLSILTAPSLRCGSRNTFCTDTQVTETRSLLHVLDELYCGTLARNRLKVIGSEISKVEHDYLLGSKKKSSKKQGPTTFHRWL